MQSTRTEGWRPGTGAAHARTGLQPGVQLTAPDTLACPVSGAGSKGLVLRLRQVCKTGRVMPPLEGAWKSAYLVKAFFLALYQFL